jgi:tRNA A-37 threonylcarbamoyl transferase component Bud32/tetratricopeptide (TPR) repeat protein
LRSLDAYASSDLNEPSDTTRGHMTIPIETPHFVRLQAAFDELAELGEEERDAAVRRLSESDPSFQAELHALLAAADRVASPLDSLALLFAEPAGAIAEEVPGFRLLRQIGRGGSAAVYLAEQVGEGFTRRVALKVVDRGPGASLARDLHAEQRILATLEHPGIARLYDAGVTPSGRPYLAMELVEGESLLDYCRTRQLPLRERLQLFLAVLEAVAHAHAAGVVHRDLKPGNVLVTERGEPKLLDFGIARLRNGEPEAGATEATLTLHRAMTPAYASPEQVGGETIDARSDLYSLGVVLYELLTERRPYRLSDTGHETLARAIREQEPVLPSSAAADLPWTDRGGLRRALRGDLDAILLKALRKEPGARYASAGDFAADLRRHLEGRPVLARRGTLLYRTGRILRRRRAILLNVLGAALLTAGFWLWIEGRQSGARGSERVNASPWLALPVRDEARESYALGLAARARYDLTEAQRALRRAAAADSGQPLVRAALADVLALSNRSEEAGREGRRALALADAARVPRESRLLIESVSLRAALQRDQETKVLRSLWLLRPGSLEIGLLFGASLVHSGGPAEAQEVVARLRRFPEPKRSDPRIDLLEIDALNAVGRSEDLVARAPAMVARAEALGLPSLAARLLLQESFAQDGLGGTEEALALADRARRIFAAHGDLGGVATSLHSICMARLRAARHDDVERDCGEVVRLNRLLGNPNGVARVLSVLGASRRRRGLFAEARKSFAEALRIGGALGNRLDEARYLHNLANLDIELGRLVEAEAGFRRAIAIKREALDRRGLAISLSSLAITLQKRGALEEAGKTLAEAEALARAIGAPRELAGLLWLGGEEARLEGERRRAAALFAEAAALFAKGEERDNLAQVRAAQALLDDPPDGQACRTLEAVERELEGMADQNAATLKIWTARCWSEAGSAPRAAPWIERAASDPLASRNAENRLELSLARSALALRRRDWGEAERRLAETDAECRRLSYGTLLFETRLLQLRLASERGDHPVRVRTLAEALQRDAQAARFGGIARRAEAIQRAPRRAKAGQLS